MRRIKLNILISILSMFMLSSSAYSTQEIIKKLELKEYHSHLLSFDEKVTRYKTEEAGVMDIEILPDIYNSRHEMLIRPLKAVDTKLIIWTQNKIYNFAIKVQKTNDGFDFLEIDLPPGFEKWTKY